MKHLSFQMKLVLIMSLLILGIICIMLVSNIGFLSRFYTISKINSLGNCYEQVNAAYNEMGNDNSDLEEAQALELERLSANSSMNLYVFSLSTEKSISFFGDPFFGSVNVNAKLNISYPKYYTDLEIKDVNSCIQRYLTEAGSGSNEKEQSEHLKNGENTISTVFIMNVSSLIILNCLVRLITNPIFISAQILKV